MKENTMKADKCHAYCKEQVMSNWKQSLVALKSL